MKRTCFSVIVFALLAVMTGCAFNSMGKASSASESPVLGRILQENKLVVGTAGSMPPFNMTAKSGEIIGLDADIARYIANGMGVELQLETMPFAELLPALQSGKVDMIISGMTITPERNLKSDFVGPYFVSGKAFLTKQERIASIQDVSELNSSKFTLAALKGSTSQFFIEDAMPKAKLITTNSYDQAIDMVLQNKVDALIADYPICLVSLLRYPDRGLLSILTLLTYEPLGIAMPPNDPHLINWMKNFLNNMEESGTLDQLKSHWFDDDSWLKRVP